MRGHRANFTELQLSLAMVFPGQGSQSQGMQADLAVDFPIVKDTYGEASSVLGFDLWELVQDGPAEKLSETVITQPAMLTAGVAAWRVWQQAGGPMPSQLSGHSLGEYSALVAAGAVDFAAAVAVVKRRAELMQGAVPIGAGALAAILGLDDEVVIEVCAEAAGNEVAQAVNFNSPGQVVIAGHKAAVGRAIELAQARGARRAIPLPVSVPVHSSLMRGAGETLAETLATTEFRNPATTVVAASDARPYVDAEDIRRRLSTQVYAPVQWADTVRAMIAAGATTIIECGPGKVLAGLTRRIDKSIGSEVIDSPESLRKALQA